MSIAGGGGSVGKAYGIHRIQPASQASRRRLFESLKKQYTLENII
jgi:hypothetical protein